MSFYRDADYSKTFLLPPSIEDWVPADHPVRFIREFVDGISDEELGYEEASDRGRPPYAPKLLLKLWIYGYLVGATSSRKLERACRELAPMIWLAGMHQPDHNTLNRFWKEQRKVIRRFFKQTVKIADRLGMVGFVLHAIDGTKIQAAGSTRNVFDKEQLEKFSARLDEQIKGIEQQIEAEENNPSELTPSLAPKLQDRRALREAINKCIQEREDDQANERLHLSETDARLMKGTGLGYNAQAVTDAKHNIIVEAAVVNEANDTHQLVPMLDRVTETYGRVAEETIADGGYNTAESLAAAAEKGYEVLLSASPHDPELNEDPYHSSKFTYNAERDVVICPQLQEMKFESEIRRVRQPYPVRAYTTNACKTCPVKASCTKDRRGRRIELHPHHKVVMQQRQKRGDPSSAAKLARRMPVAERVFAVIKGLLGFRRFRRNGAETASTEWNFVCAIQNMLQMQWNTSSKPA